MLVSIEIDYAERDKNARWQEDIAPAAGEEGNSKLLFQSASSIDGIHSALTPKMATLLTTLAFSGEVKAS
jgi:hypothetical protein